MDVNSNYINFVSIVIISYDPTVAQLKKTLSVLLKQSYRNFEVILVDSGKEELSTQLLKTTLHNTTISHTSIALKPKGTRFNYAHAYNVGIRKSKGDIIIRLSGDAVPIGSLWIKRCVELMQNKEIGIISGMDIIKNQLSLDTYLLSAVYERVKNTAFQPKNRNVIKNIPLINGPCMVIRRSIWTRHKFNETWLWGEELEFGAWALRNGYYLLFDPRVRILHSHRLETAEAVQRIGSDALMIYKAKKLFQDQAILAMQSMLKSSLEVPFAQIERGRQYYLHNGSAEKFRKYMKELTKLKKFFS
ncbi:glycosyltransferase [Candidatus Woesebacteria bacterium]|nr:glycosyltransferase [Candidatus Woesebacteria bacterium]